MQLPKCAVFVLWNAPYPVPRLTLAGRSGGPLPKSLSPPSFSGRPPTNSPPAGYWLLKMLINWLVKMLINRLVKILINWLVKMLSTGSW